MALGDAAKKAADRAGSSLTERLEVRSSRTHLELSEATLLAGIETWRGRNFNRYFHARLYEDHANYRRTGRLTETWWRRIVEVLSSWRATRGKGFGKEKIREAGLEDLGALNVAWQRVVDEELEFGEANWSSLEPLFERARQLKPTKGQSPVFPSKLCHLLLPTLFVVWDRTAVGGEGNYPKYWQECSLAWGQATGDLHRLLRDTLVREAGLLPDPSFPFATKISELCVIGTRVRSRG